MKLLDQEKEIRQQIFDYFGYKEDWRVLPFEDCREYYWFSCDNNSGEVVYAPTEYELIHDEGDIYVSEIYENRHLNKWVYRGEEYTMIITNPHTDGNQFLTIFDNSKEIN